MADDDLGLDAHLVDQRAEAQAQGLHAEQVDLRRGMPHAEQPARVVFAEARGLHQRQGFELSVLALRSARGEGNMNELTNGEGGVGEKGPKLNAPGLVGWSAPQAAARAGRRPERGLDRR